MVPFTLFLVLGSLLKVTTPKERALLLSYGYWATKELRADMIFIKTAVEQNVFAVGFALGHPAELGQLAATQVMKRLGVTTENLGHELVNHAEDVCRWLGARCYPPESVLQALRAFLHDLDQGDQGKVPDQTHVMAAKTLWKRFALEGVKHLPFLFYRQLPTEEKRDVEIAVKAVQHDAQLFPYHLPGQLRQHFEAPGFEWETIRKNCVSRIYGRSRSRVSYPSPHTPVNGDQTWTRALNPKP